MELTNIPTYQAAHVTNLEILDDGVLQVSFGKHGQEPILIFEEDPAEYRAHLVELIEWVDSTVLAWERRDHPSLWQKPKPRFRNPPQIVNLSSPPSAGLTLVDMLRRNYAICEREEKDRILDARDTELDAF